MIDLCTVLVIISCCMRRVRGGGVDCLCGIPLVFGALVSLLSFALFGFCTVVVFGGDCSDLFFSYGACRCSIYFAACF